MPNIIYLYMYLEKVCHPSLGPKPDLTETTAYWRQWVHWTYNHCIWELLL